MATVASILLAGTAYMGQAKATPSKSGVDVHQASNLAKSDAVRLAESKSPYKPLHELFKGGSNDNGAASAAGTSGAGGDSGGDSGGAGGGGGGGGAGGAGGAGGGR